MPDQQNSTNSTPGKKRKPHKDDVVRARIDPELHQQAQQKAETMGWSLGSVIRALLRLWVQEDIVGSNDVGEESQRAPKVPRVPKKKKPKRKK